VSRIVLFLAVFTLSLVSISLAHGQRAESQNSDPTINSQYLDRLDGPLFNNSFSRVFANECPVVHPEKPAICECGPTKVKKQAECHSCYKAGGQRCGGPYCQACVVVCDPRGVVPAPKCN
jgi:7-cyano-7-deazaguanine synthase in queuosine biosynthesis